jgi:hypothetical protein
VTLDRLDTFSAACLSNPRIGAPVTANNLGKLRTWAHFEDGLSLSGQGLITCWNPWALEDSAYPACPGKIVAAFPTCEDGVAAVVNAWLNDVPAIVANLRADGPWSAWTEQPILCQLGYWIHGTQCGGVYSGWGSVFETATTGAPDPAYGCTTSGCAGTCPACQTCSGSVCVSACKPGQACIDGLCQTAATPPAPSSDYLIPALVVGALAGGGWWWTHRGSGGGAKSPRRGRAGGSRSAPDGFAPSRPRRARSRRGDRQSSTASGFGVG